MRVTIHIKPCAKARPRFSKGRAYMPKAYMDWRKLFAFLWRGCVPRTTPQFDKAFTVDIVFHTETGKMRPDLDNAAAAVLDVLQDVQIITNDKYVTALTCSVVKADSKFIVITLTQVAQ